MVGRVILVELVGTSRGMTLVALPRSTGGRDRGDDDGQGLAVMVHNFPKTPQKSPFFSLAKGPG